VKKEPNDWGISGGRPDVGLGGGSRGIGHGGVGMGAGLGPDSRGGNIGLGGGVGNIGVGMIPHEQNNHNNHSSIGGGVRGGVGSGGWSGDDVVGVRGGMSGRNPNLDNGGNNPGMWNKPNQVPPQVQQQQQQQMPGMQQQQQGWGGPGHSGLGMNKPDKGPAGSSSGWDDVSPPTQRRPVPNIPNYDDGTAVWGGGGPQPGGHPNNMRMGGPPPGANRGGVGMPNKMVVDDSPVGWGGGNRLVLVVVNNY
jgi:hypothetical protein